MSVDPLPKTQFMSLTSSAGMLEVVTVGPTQTQIILQEWTWYVLINGVGILKSKMHILYPVYLDYRHWEHLSQFF